MKKIGDVTTTANSEGEWTNGNPAQGISPTVLESAWLNTVQREIANTITGAGMELNPENDSQLVEAIKYFIKNLQASGVLTVNSKKPDEKGNIKLGTAANADVGTEKDNVMQVGAFGLGTGARHREDAYTTVAEIFRTTKESANRPGDEIYGVLSLPCDTGPVNGYIAVSNNGALFIGISQPDAALKWSRVYGANNKPSASDVGLGNVGNYKSVQQGGVANQANNKVYIGWGNDGILRCTVDATDLGQIFTTLSPPTAKETRALSLDGGTVNGVVEVIGSAITRGAYLIRNENGDQIASVSAKSDGSITVWSDVNGHSFGLNSAGGFYTSAGTAIIEAGQRVYSPNNPPPNTTQLSVNGDSWWYRDLRTGMIFQGGFASGSASGDGAIDRIALNIAVPNRLLFVSTIIKNFSQGYQTTWNPQTRNLGSERNGFDWIHGSQEREVYWMAIGY